MQDSVVRLNSIEIKNFKNVKNGRLTFNNPRKPYKASILGLYGQNGSGKTALIDALSLLKYALSMKSIPSHFIDYINVDAEYATVKYEFKITRTSHDSEYTVFYEVSLRSQLEDPDMTNTFQNEDNVTTSRAVLFDEVLSLAYREGEKRHRQRLIVDTRSSDSRSQISEAFSPMSSYKLLVGTDSISDTNLLVAKKYAYATSHSFVFSRELLNQILQNCKDESMLFIFNRLIRYGSYELFVINTTNSGLIAMNTLPLTFKYAESSCFTIGTLTLKLSGATLVPNEAFHVVKKVIACMNIVLQQVVPGLTIEALEIGNQLMKDGRTGSNVQLVSHRNGKSIPLQFESEGIKKIISILQLLIAVYNTPSNTVAIDELDSGVFEYLLGELLRIISEKGKGQLIFTSHNLRPLESIDRGFVAFTTVNPDNRYTRLRNVKPNHNLRDFYYRDIVLGEQNDPVYEAANNYDIALAFREAGELSGS